MKDFQNNILIGIWSGSIAGFVILFTQSFLTAYGQPLNMAFAFSIILLINILIVYVVAAHNSKRSKKKGKK